MRKIIAFVFVFLCVVPYCSAVKKRESHFPSYKPEMVDVLSLADKQNDLLKALLSNVRVNPNDFTVDEVDATLTKLEACMEKLREQQQRSGGLDEEERQYLSLAQTLAHHLTVSCRDYRSRARKSESTKKIAISLGTAVAVCGGLLALNWLTPIQIKWGTALVCGILSGAVVGVVTHQAEVLEGMRAASHSLQNSVGATSWPFGTSATIAVGITASSLIGLWFGRGLIADLFASRRLARRSLAQAAAAVGISV